MALILNEMKSTTSSSYSSSLNSSAGDFKTLIAQFSIPTDLLDDIIYCQRSLRMYMRVHQILVSRLPDKMKTKHLEEIERDISDIGREQNNLISRLRRILETYYVSIRNDNVEIDREIGNAYVSRVLSHHIESGNTIITPKFVRKRMTELQLLGHYSLHDLRRKLEKIEATKQLAAVNSLKQESLLKPKSERFALQKSNGFPYTASRKIEYESIGEKPTATSARSINSSRMNLLQALNKARNQNIHLTKPKRISPALKVDSKDTIEISSSSASDESSLDVPLVSPVYSEDEAEMSQELFLRKFGLYTTDYSQYLIHKRSQRRRRNVQSNEKSDYHYGKLELFEKMNKRKKTYLHSPPAPRVIKRRRFDKELNSGSNSKQVSDRSTSSSPDQKHVCCECNKSDNLLKCDTCLSWYHLECHKVPTKQIGKKICSGCYLKLRESNSSKGSNDDENDVKVRKVEEVKGKNVKVVKEVAADVSIEC